MWRLSVCGAVDDLHATREQRLSTRRDDLTDGDDIYVIGWMAVVIHHSTGFPVPRDRVGSVEAEQGGASKPSAGRPSTFGIFGLLMPLVKLPAVSNLTGGLGCLTCEIRGSSRSQPRRMNTKTPRIITINLDKIDQSAVYEGKKGRYLTMVEFDNDDGEDQYGNHGRLVQDLGKERRMGGEKGAILGNWKPLAGGGGGDRRQEAAERRQEAQDFRREQARDAAAERTVNSSAAADDDDIPF